jgi:hypothetical protein
MANQKTFSKPDFSSKGFTKRVANFNQSQNYEIQMVESSNYVMIPSNAKDYIKGIY